jgi:FAD/FMN-containing dehydrogenase
MNGLDIPGSVFRKAGLGKDVTDKFLSWLAGHPKRRLRRLDHQCALDFAPHARHTRTVCLEFFGHAHEAVPSIVEIKDYHVRAGQNARGTLLAGSGAFGPTAI